MIHNASDGALRSLPDARGSMSPDSGNLNRDSSSFMGRILCEDYRHAFSEGAKEMRFDSGLLFGF